MNDVADDKVIAGALHEVMRESAEKVQRLKERAKNPNGLDDPSGYLTRQFYLESEGTDSISTGLKNKVQRQHALTTRQRHHLLAAFHRFVADGFILPHATRSETYVFTFTDAGLDYFIRGQVNLHRQGGLHDALAALSPGIVSESQMKLLTEAHACWSHGCYRAAVVLVGVATENAIIALLNSLSTYPAQSQTNAEWKDAANSGNSISARFESGIALLRRLEVPIAREATKRFRSGKPAPWGQLWSARNIDALSSIGDAIRCARNAAAHGGAEPFGRSSVGLLLASTPSLLQHVHDLIAFFAADVTKALDPLPPPVV